MLALLVSFVRTHWQTAIIASLLLCIALAFAFQRFEIHRLQAKLMQCKSEIVTLERSNNALTLAIKDQNAAIKAHGAVTRKKKDAALHALSGAKKQAKFHTLKAERIKAQTLSSNECINLQKLVNDFVNNSTR